MKCEKCGATLPENAVRCIYCGETLQMVPDYNPLGDVVENEIRASIQVEPNEDNLYYTQSLRTARNTGRMVKRDPERVRDSRSREGRPREERQREERLREGRPREDRPREGRPREDRVREGRPREDRVREGRPREDRPREGRPREDRVREGRPREDRPRNPRPREDRQREDRQRENKPREAKTADSNKRRDIDKRRQIEKKKAQQKKKRNILLGVIGGVLLLVIISVSLIYTNSYNGQMSKGWKAVENEDIELAIEYFEKAMDKNPTNVKAYIALAEVYMSENDYDSAEAILLEGIANNPDNLSLNEALIDFYVANGDMDKINEFMETLTSASIIKSLSSYSSSVPEFSLAEGEYEDVQELTLTSSEEFIYYTTDGTEATVNSECYTTAIQIGEGTTVVRAISVNSEGVPSFEVEMEYVVELPMVSAPVVSPTTGQYTEEMEIEVTVPSGYTAYYTLDNTTPTIDSLEYTGPIDMPEGNTIFTVILINSSGKSSDMTKRNYDLVLPDEDDE